jgi:hypothetical protein
MRLGSYINVGNYPVGRPTNQQLTIDEGGGPSQLGPFNISPTLKLFFILKKGIKHILQNEREIIEASIEMGY